MFLNNLDHFQLAAEMPDRLTSLGAKEAYVKQSLRDKMIEPKQTTTFQGQDMLEIRSWTWPAETSRVSR